MQEFYIPLVSEKLLRLSFSVQESGYLTPNLLLLKYDSHFWIPAHHLNDKNVSMPNLPLLQLKAGQMVLSYNHLPQDLSLLFYHNFVFSQTKSELAYYLFYESVSSVHIHPSPAS